MRGFFGFAALLSVAGAAAFSACAEDITIYDEWAVRVRDGETVRTLTVERPEERTVVAERYDVLPAPEARKFYAKSCKLMGVRAFECSVKGALIPESVALRSLDGRPLVPGADYVLDGVWGGIEAAATNSPAIGQPFLADYSYRLSRIDSVVRADGSVRIRKGLSHVANPEPPALDQGEERLANVFVRASATRLEPASVYPIAAQPPSVRRSAHPVAERFLPKTMKALSEGGDVHILFWGDSVTDGGYLPEGSRWTAQFTKRLRSRFPRATIRVSISAWPGRKSVDFLGRTEEDAHSYERTVLGLRPDLVISEFVNDAALSPTQTVVSYSRYLDDFRAIGAEWLPIVPHYVWPAWMGAGFVDGPERGEDVRPYVAALRGFAARNGLPLADAAVRWAYLRSEGIPYETLFCNTINHPNEMGMRFFADALMEVFGGDAEPAETMAVPLITVRHTPAINDDPETFARIAGIHRANPGACDEVWFADGSIDALDGVRKTAAKIAAFREDCERSGIGLSFQHGRTLGHGPSHDGKARAAEHPFSAGDWQVGRDGRPLEGILCPRSPAVLAYARDYARTLVETVHPKTYWLDDDLRMGVCKPNGCFCDRCLKAFNAETGSSWTREPLAEKLLDSPSPEPVREAWIAFNQRSLALYAAAVREGVEAADPDCRLGYQSVWADAIYTGRDYRPLLEALSGPRHRPVGIRPGAGFYNESSPRGMVAKTLSVAREAERCRAYGFVGRICYENETYPRRILHKSPGAIVTECALALACGADSLSLYWYDGSMPEPLAEYGRFAKTVAASRPYLARLAASSARTRMIGISRFVGSAAARCRDLDLRDPCDAALALAGVPVSVEEAGFPLWYVTEKSRAEMTDADRTVLSGKTVDLPDGLVAGPFRGFLRAEERTAILDAMDRIVPGGFPVRLEECRAVRIVPRVTADGRLDSVTLLNCSIGETDELTLHLRVPFRPALAWTSPRRPDRTLDVERTGADWTVRIPSLDPWQVVTVYVKEEK